MVVGPMIGHKEGLVIVGGNCTIQVGNSTSSLVLGFSSSYFRDFHTQEKRSFGQLQVTLYIWCQLLIV